MKVFCYKDSHHTPFPCYICALAAMPRGHNINIMQSWTDYQTQHKDRFLSELLELLRIPSISARTEHGPDMLKCAEAVKQSLINAGVDKAEIFPTEGHP